MNAYSVMPVLAQCGAPTGGDAMGGSGGSIQFVGMMLIILALFYVMIIVPQRRKDRERKELIAATKTGDRILFSGGIIGTVANVKDSTFVVKIADKVKIEILKGSVVKVLERDAEITDSDNQQAGSGAV